MADYGSENNVRVDYVASIANPAAPDASSELASTTRLDTKITPDGWNSATDEAEVSTASLASKYRTSVDGTRGGPIEITIKRDSVPASDTIYNLVKAAPSGFLVTREAQGGADAAYAAGQIVDVMPGKFGKPRMDSTAENTARTYKVKWYPSAEPSEAVTVVA